VLTMGNKGANKIAIGKVIMAKSNILVNHIL
jgi:hypothetical protein